MKKKKEYISVSGATQNNLKNISVQIPLNALTVVTGVSGSGKSSLAFDTIYAEGQRRYVETFSSYARQFLDRMDKPQVKKIESLPPAIAIDQTNPVRTSRSTVGTMTELNDHLKLLFARASRLYCRSCGMPVGKDSPDSIVQSLSLHQVPEKSFLLITFPVPVPGNLTTEETVAMLRAQGYTRIHAQSDAEIIVIQDRCTYTHAQSSRITEALEGALHAGHGRVTLYYADTPSGPYTPLRFSSHFHCAQCDIDYSDVTPNHFSFNSPVGACAVCRGFGRTIGVDYTLVIPDEAKTLAEGAVKPWQTGSYLECQDDLIRFAHRRKIPVTVPWNKLSEKHKKWVLEGEGEWEDGHWYGVRRFFDWLETKSYKMHIRVLLSRYRSYHLCESCKGARLKPESLLWKIGNESQHSIHDLQTMPLGDLHFFFKDLVLPKPLDEATEVLLGEIRSRLTYLCDVGLTYLTLDRQSRTLSGGEVQRINLTTALGTSLVNTLFVLDEPSIGLHSRDIGRLIGILHRLRDAGNTILVVEHDPELIRAADCVIDMGPGPGEHGGSIVFQGSVSALERDRSSLTGKYLSGVKKTALAVQPRPVNRNTARLTITGASEHNLKNVSVKIPLNRVVCVTGVSGSGKSTLIQDVCYNAIRKLKGTPVETPGVYKVISGYEDFEDVILVNQSPIGKTTRSNPASYIGVVDAIRKRFATSPIAKARGYTPGMFSFNSGDGRCPACSGSGFEHVEMQFLSDVYIRCSECNGKRFRPEILEIKLNGAGMINKPEGRAMSIADILDLTVSEAREFFQDVAAITNGLRVLEEVGLSYVKLGQPLPTLSGGEAQRLKLAAHLGGKKKKNNGPLLFLLDEPTTGLHFHDIEVLIQAFFKLRDHGHSLVIIEHNLDVIAAADYIIDLGPEGGEAGGEILCTGTPDQIAGHPHSRTGAVLRAYREQQNTPSPAVAAESLTGEYHSGGGADDILVQGAREHNLKNVSLSVPHNSFTVITGVSGSGKSTIAFDILFAEGQRRYLESLNAYARQFVQPASRPDVDSLTGIPPTVAIEQRASRGGRKSTVATVTELYHFLRLLYVKLGVQYCPDCQIPIEPQTPSQIISTVMKKHRGKKIGIYAPLISARKGIYTDLAKWAVKNNFPALVVDGELLSTERWPVLDRYREHDIDLPIGSFLVTPENEVMLTSATHKALQYGHNRVYIGPAPDTSSGNSRSAWTLFSTERTCPGCQKSFDEPDPRMFSYNSRHGWCPQCFGTGLEMAGFDEEQSGEEIWWNQWWDGEEKVCRSCQGARLKKESLSVMYKNNSIADVAAMSVNQAWDYFSNISLAGREKMIARDLVKELGNRLAFLKEVGLGYLTLDRSAPTLSGGEAQRIRLAGQLGSNLRGVCYILDEPTIGLHSRDNDRLLDTLEKLRAKGNTLVVVEHDEQTIRRSSKIIDLGPGGGVTGGTIIAEGTAAKLEKNPESLTGKYLKNPLRHPVSGTRRPFSIRSKKPRLTIEGAYLHNLKKMNVHVPLNRLVCVSGVSGSGKSTLIRNILLENLAELLKKNGAGKRQKNHFNYLGCTTIRGTELVSRVLEVDQRPIGKTPRSCPATYVGIWDAIRKLFARTPEAVMRGYSASRFSFNVKGGRCPECEGQGMKKIEMNFLPNVSVSCDTCNGDRFNRETLEVTYKGKTISDVLRMDIDEAVAFFNAHRPIHHALKLLQWVGLGYLTLGQQSPTLSGGEAQRIKLVSELAKAEKSKDMALRKNRKNREDTVSVDKGTLFVLDEPTIGLHIADVEKLIRVLHRLVDMGNSVVVIEHNLDIIAEADWIIDLGPDGGDGGGKIVAQGSPESIVSKNTFSATALYLKPHLQN